MNRGTFTVTTTGSPAPAITESGALPAGVTLTDNHNGTATLAGTAATCTAGTYPITITAANGVGANATQSFVLTVTDDADRADHHERRPPRRSRSAAGARSR